MNRKIIVAKNKEHLKKLLKREIAKYGNECDLNHIDVSQVTNMSHLFQNSKFNGDISKWDVSNVTTIRAIFSDSKFNGDISGWNVSNITDIAWSFYDSQFNGDISKWNVSNVNNMEHIFYSSKFTGNLDSWTPYFLKQSRDLSDNPNFNMPYWGKLGSNDEIRETIAIRQKAELEQELSIITTITPKNKVKL